jgi:hypothetical protein
MDLNCKDCKGSGVVKTSEFEYQECPCMKKNPHGGKRKGSGRKKGEPTTVIRVRVSKLDEIKKINES